MALNDIVNDACRLIVIQGGFGFFVEKRMLAWIFISSPHWILISSVIQIGKFWFSKGLFCPTPSQSAALR